jgi:hypothetical protein
MEGSQPIGAIVSVGEKGPRGNPINKDRFFISSTSFVDVGNNAKGMRGKKHPRDDRFKAFNDLPSGDNAATIRGLLLYMPEADNLHYSRTARTIKKGVSIPGNVPACVGNGETAKRFCGVGPDGKAQFNEIPCPGDKCEFAARIGAAPPCCKPFARLFFSLRWPDGNPLPRLFVRYQTQSVYTVDNIIGMFRQVQEIAESWKLEPDQWGFSGLPFVMKVGEHTIPEKGRKFPVVAFSVEGNPGDFLMAQVEQKRGLLTAPRSTHLLAAGNSAIGDPADIVDALAELTPGPISTPASTEEPETVAPDVVDAEPVDVEPVAEPVADAPPFTKTPPYRIEEGDPRSPVDRIKEWNRDTLHSAAGGKLVTWVCDKVAGCKPLEVSEVWEMHVAHRILVELAKNGNETAVELLAPPPQDGAS